MKDLYVWFIETTLRNLLPYYSDEELQFASKYLLNKGVDPSHPQISEVIWMELMREINFEKRA